MHGGHIVAQGTPAEIMKNPKSLTGKYLTGEMSVAIPERKPPNHRRTIKVVNARGNNLKNVSAEIPLGAVHLRHRRLRRRQVDAPDRHALQGDRPQAEQRQRRRRPARPHRGAGAYRQDHRHRPVADRPHAALEPRDLYRRLHADPRMVRRPARGEGARLRARPLLLQRQGRPLRGLPGRRRHQDRDALSARRLRHLRHLQGQALQPRDAGSPVQGQEHRRRARHDGGRSRRVLQGGARASAKRSRRCTASASTTSTSASRRRRSPAAKPSASSWRRNCQSAPPAARSTSWTSRPPACISTTSQSYWKCCTSWSRRATRWS